jgi:uncharacterized protein YdhG (YjbR/CyaY superfamily)
MSAPKFNSVDEYLASLDPTKARTIRSVIDLILTQFPELESKISWNVPTIHRNGKYVVGVCAYKHHLTFSAWSPRVIEDFKTRLGKYVGTSSPSSTNLLADQTVIIAVQNSGSRIPSARSIFQRLQPLRLSANRLEDADDAEDQEYYRPDDRQDPHDDRADGVRDADQRYRDEIMQEGDNEICQQRRKHD